MKIVELEHASLEAYGSYIGDGSVERLSSLAARLKGARIAHVNATANGGGVAEILQSTVPLYNGLGMETTWLVLEAELPFFNVTKQLHNALQGAERTFTTEDRDLYLETIRRNAQAMAADYDVVFVHDPQPAALRRLAPENDSSWIWRCHIDTSTPNGEAWSWISSLAHDYDAAIFSIPEFVGPGLAVPTIRIIPPAIDPIMPKNRPMPLGEMEKVLASHGVDLSRPFITQVSRFDPWKDPIGVIACFKQLKEVHHDLQLLLLGNFASDDPEGVVLYEQVVDVARDVPDVNIITGLTDLVNPFQALSKVVVQKSVREGFGLTVTEALWKGTPVVAGNVGGIRIQIEDGVSGFLVDSVEECVQRIDYLLTQEDERRSMGQAGRERVRSNFLIHRLLEDELNLADELLNPGQVKAITGGDR